jgi:TPR repeat protein
MADEHRSPLKPLIIGMLGMALTAIVTLTLHGIMTLGELQQRGYDEASRQAKEWEDERARRIAARAKIDVAMAFAELRRKAGAGDPDAQFLLGSILLVGMADVIQIDPATGLRISSSEQLEALVGKKFDELHEQPFMNLPAVPPDQQAAQRWLERAARQGQAEAQVRLAHELENSDPPQALRWIMIADRGWPTDRPTILVGTDELRNELRRRFLGTLSPEKIAEAQRQAVYFRPTKE